MNRNNIVSKLIVTISSLAAGCALAFTGLFFSPATAHAAPAPMAQEGAPGPGRDGVGLELICREQKRLLEGQQDRLNFANDIAAQAETWINEQKGKGKDVSTLETALANYKSGIASAQAKHDEAQSIIDAHASFDADCKMTDRDQAKTTLRSTRDALREAHRLLADAGREFRRAVRDWRQANRPANATPAP